MSPELYSLLFTKILPSFGVVVSVALSLSPMPSVLRIMRTGEGLGGLNPIPFPFLFSNALGWLAYGAVQHDIMIILPNVIGGILSLFYITVCAEHGNQRERFTNRIIAFSTLTILGTVVVLGMFVVKSAHTQLLMYGFTTNAILICFFTSPLSGMVQVVRMRDASSISLPIAIASLVNCVLWVAYGVCKTDPFIYVPNGIGLASSILQLFLKMIFRNSDAYENLKGSPVPDRSSWSSATSGVCQPASTSPKVKALGPLDALDGIASSGDAYDVAVVVRDQARDSRDRRASRRESVSAVSAPVRLS
eukprot:Opistho-2@63637